MLDTLPVVLHVDASALVARLDQILIAVQQLEASMSKQLDDLKNQVASNIAVEQSAITLITGLSAQILALKDDPAALEALAAELKTEADALGAAVAANTPANPA